MARMSGRLFSLKIVGNETLKQLGLDHQIKYSKKLQGDIKRTELAQERYNQSIYSGAEIKELCNTYDLRILPANYYNGSIPVDLARKIKAFCEEQDIIIRQNSFYILAPTEQFKTLKHVPISADPILFYLDGSAESSSSYERSIKESDKLINVHYWGNDFSFLRKFKWLVTTYRYRDDHWSNLGRTICALIPFVLALTFIIFANFPLPLFFSILGCGISFWLFYASLRYKNYYMDELWNTNKI